YAWWRLGEMCAASSRCPRRIPRSSMPDTSYAERFALPRGHRRHSDRKTDSTGSVRNGRASGGFCRSAGGTETALESRVARCAFCGARDLSAKWGRGRSRRGASSWRCHAARRRADGPWLHWRVEREAIAAPVRQWAIDEKSVLALRGGL